MKLVFDEEPGVIPALLLICADCAFESAPQHRLEDREECFGDDLRPFGRGMDAVALNGAGNIHQIDIQHWHQSHMMFGRKVAKNLIERSDVVRAVIGGKGDSGEQDPDMQALESCERLIEI